MPFLLALKALPWQLWAALAAVLAITGFGLYERHQGVLEERAICEKRVAAITAQYEAQIKAAHDTAQAKLDSLAGDLTSQQIDRAQEAKDAEDRRVSELAKLKGSFTYAPIQLARCTDLPRQFLRNAERAAAYANGGAEIAAAAGPPSVALDPPSGVSIPAYTDTVGDQAGAYRSCRDRVVTWEHWAADVDAYHLKLQSILEAK